MICFPFRNHFVPVFVTRYTFIFWKYTPDKAECTSSCLGITFFHNALSKADGRWLHRLCFSFSKFSIGFIRHDVDNFHVCLEYSWIFQTISNYNSLNWGKLLITLRISHYLDPFKECLSTWPVVSCRGGFFSEDWNTFSTMSHNESERAMNREL
jgi:hypothetical protein